MSYRIGSLTKSNHQAGIHMAHNIGQMFYFGEVPWHGLGRRIEQPANLDEALAAGGLDWTVSLAPLGLKDEPESPVPQRMAVVRDDIIAGRAGRVLGVVHPGFKALQNRDGAVLFDSLFGKGDRVYHTGGYLKRGEVVWLMAKLREDIRLPGDDMLNTFLLFSNSHDGSFPIDIRLTTVRVVCNNTLSLAVKQKTQGNFFRRGHSGSLELVQAEADAFFQSILAQQTNAAEGMAKLVEAKCTESAFAEFLKRLLPVPAKPANASVNPKVDKAYATRANSVIAKRDEIMEVHLHGLKVGGTQHLVIPPADLNWWGCLNSITAWVDHVSETDGDRYAHLMFGTGDRLKTEAYQRVVAEAGIK